MLKEITREELEAHKSKLQFRIDDKMIDPYPYLSKIHKIGIYASEVLFSHRGRYWENLNNNNYVLEDKYQGTTSDPTNMKMVLDIFERIDGIRKINIK